WSFPRVAERVNWRKRAELSSGGAAPSPVRGRATLEPGDQSFPGPPPGLDSNLTGLRAGFGAGAQQALLGGRLGGAWDIGRVSYKGGFECSDTQSIPALWNFRSELVHPR
ncbi:hypothetical protein S40288_11226, partial [Stachybotrys chartarum IBT 40288]